MSRVPVSSATPTPDPPRPCPPPALVFEEGTLLARAARRDMQAWAQLYQQHHAAVYRRLRFLTGRASVAEDLSQECFVQAMVKLHQLRDPAKFPMWLSGIALNLARNHWRKTRNSDRAYDGFQRLHDIALSQRPGVEERLAEHRRLSAIYQQLEELPEHLRTVFILRDIEGLSAKEIAEILEISVSNVGARASRARAQIRQALESSGLAREKGVV